MPVLDLQPDHFQVIREVAALLKNNFPHDWQTDDDAYTEVLESLQPGRINRVLVDEQQSVIGWVAARPLYDGRVWEVHPLVVRCADQRKGYGAILMRDLEQQVASLGGLTLWLGTDDHNGQTSLSDSDLYENLWQKVQHIQNLAHHPYGFYLKLGFQIVGVVPDANGLGKPDILMAKRVQTEE